MPETPKSESRTSDARVSQGQATHAAASRSDVIFKVIAYRGIRHGLKLEQIFWRVLRFAANRADQPLNAYIASRLAEAEGNKTAALRVHAVEWLTRQLVEARAHGIHPSMLRKIVAALPVPSILIDLNHRVVAQNDAF